MQNLSQPQIIFGTLNKIDLIYIDVIKKINYSKPPVSFVSSGLDTLIQDLKAFKPVVLFCSDLKGTDFKRIEEVLKSIKPWVKVGNLKVFIFCSNHEETIQKVDKDIAHDLFLLNENIKVEDFKKELFKVAFGFLTKSDPKTKYSFSKIKHKVLFQTHLSSEDINDPAFKKLTPPNPGAKYKIKQTEILLPNGLWRPICPMPNSVNTQENFYAFLPQHTADLSTPDNTWCLNSTTEPVFDSLDQTWNFLENKPILLDKKNYPEALQRFFKEIGSEGNKNLQILIVDDMATVRKLLTYQLKEVGVLTVLEAKDVRQAWEILNQQNVSVHAIFSDWELTGQTGFDLLKRVRAESRIAHTPFVMLTLPDDEVETGFQCMQQNVTDVLLKPFTQLDLGIRGIFNQKEIVSIARLGAYWFQLQFFQIFFNPNKN